MSENATLEDCKNAILYFIIAVNHFVHTRVDQLLESRITFMGDVITHMQVKCLKMKTATCEGL